MKKIVRGALLDVAQELLAELDTELIRLGLATTGVLQRFLRVMPWYLRITVGADRRNICILSRFVFLRLIVTRGL